MIRPPRSIFGGLAWKGAVVGVLAFFLWFRGVNDRPASLLTGLYTQALAARQSYLLLAPNAALLTAVDPYDPDVNRPVRVLDASLFHGHYYLFFGITPFITLLVPWLWLFGRQLSDSWAIAAYCTGSLLASALILGDAARRYFPRAGSLARFLAVAGASFGGGGLILLGSPTIHELDIAACWFYDCAALLAVYWVLHGARHPRLGLALAGAAVGLAVGARPNHVLTAAVITLFILAQTRAMSRGRADWLRNGVKCLLPLAGIAGALGWWNWHRFGNPLEFGYRYALVDVRNFAAAFASLRNVSYNLWYYLVGLPHFSGWFPFFEAPALAPLPVPRDYYTLDQVYGMLVTAPLTLCLAALGRGWNRRPPSLRTLLLLLLAIGGANLAFLSVMNAAVFRYSVDFHPYFALAGALGLLALAETRGESRLHWLGAAAAGLLAVASIGSSACEAFALYDFGRTTDAPAVRLVGRVFDAPRLWWEDWRRTPLQEFRVEATPPRGALGGLSPLFVTGRPSFQDFIYLYYSGPRQLQVGFESTGRGGPVSAPIPINYGEPAVLDLALGNQWPPPGARVYHGLSIGAVQTLRRRLLVRVNGALALDTWVDYHPDKGRYFWGRSPDEGAYGPALPGPLKVRTVPLPDFARIVAENPGDYGSVRLRLSRDRHGPARARQPLVCIGYRNRWQALALIADDDHRVRFLIGTSGGANEVVSEGVKMAPGIDYTLELSAGGLLPPPGSQLWGSLTAREQEARRRSVRLTLDGRTIIEADVAGAPEVGPSAIVLGKNSLGSSSLAMEFSGQIQLLGRGGVNPGSSAP